MVLQFLKILYIKRTFQCKRIHEFTFFLPEHFKQIQMMFQMNQMMFPSNVYVPKTEQRIRFTPVEDERLKQLVSQQITPNWNEISRYMGNRTPRQCRERYNNYLRPELINGRWTKEEDELLNKLYAQYGPKWSLIAQSFKSRSAVNVKNHHSTLVIQNDLKARNQKAQQQQIQEQQIIQQPVVQQPIVQQPMIQQQFIQQQVEQLPVVQQIQPIEQQYIPNTEQFIIPPHYEDSLIYENEPFGNNENNSFNDQYYENMFSNFAVDEHSLWSSELPMESNLDDLLVF